MPKAPSLIQSVAEYEFSLEQSFYAFVLEAWEYIDPSPIIPKRYMRIYCDHLQALQEQVFTHLLISASFGIGKSNVAMVLFPVWMWILNPAEQFLTGSHNYRDVAMRDTGKSRDLIKSDWFQFHWGERVKIKADHDEKSYYVTTEKGFRMIFTTRTGITGKRAGNIFIDDPLDIDDAYRKLERTRVINHINKGVTTRLNDMGRHRVLVQAQRLNINDPIGELSKQKHWVHLNLPYEFRKSTCYVTPLGSDWRTEENELLTTLHDDKWIEQKKIEMGDDWEVQANQNPTANGQTPFKEEYFCYYESDEKRAYTVRFQAWDTAVKEGQENDWSCCVTIEAKYNLVEKRTRFYVIDVFKVKLTPDFLKEKIREKKKEFNCNYVGIEDKSSGEYLIPELQRGDHQNIPIKIYPLPALNSKLARANSISPIMKRGDILFPTHAPWLKDFKEELTMFPNADHDDQFDAFVHVIAMAEGKSKLLRYEALAH